MMLTLNPRDENSLLTGLDFALTNLAFEQSLKVVFICSGSQQNINLAPEVAHKLKTLHEMGLGVIHHLERMNVQNIPANLPSKTLSAFEYSNMAKHCRAIVSF